MGSVQFEDLNSFRAEGYYVVPNEDVLTWREMLKRTPIYKAAAICSAGEVGLLGLLPLVRQELVLVDHSYSSLWFAMTKYLVLQDLGWEKAHALFAKGTSTEIQESIKSVVDQLPETVSCRIPARRETYFRTQTHKVWGAVPKAVVHKSSTKLDKVKFIHGDLTDLISKGPFGLLYLSNALEHRDRTARKPVVEQVEKVVRPGGYVVCCGSGAPATWELLSSVTCKANFMGWKHQLYRVPA